MSLGGTEFLIIALVALLLFAPSLLAFWVGYTIGRRTPAETSKITKPASPEEERADVADSAPTLPRGTAEASAEGSADALDTHDAKDMSDG